LKYKEIIALLTGNEQRQEMPNVDND